jgi:hypothetical protein
VRCHWFNAFKIIRAAVVEDGVSKYKIGLWTYKGHQGLFFHFRTSNYSPIFKKYAGYTVCPGIGSLLVSLSLI